MRKKGVIITICICLLLAVLAGGIYWFMHRSEGGPTGSEGVYTQSVASILGVENSLGVTNRYTGVVEAQRSESINADSNRTVKEILVNEGDVVEEGTPLFTYDVEEEQLALEQSRLELERLNNSLVTLKDEIKELEAERAKASSGDKLEYTLQIQSKQLDVKQAEYDIQVKETEIVQKEQIVENTTVLSPMAGIVQSINENSGEDFYSPYGGGADNGLIQILSTGMYRVKCKASEQDIWNLSQGDTVIVRSRITDDTWTGVIEEINTSGPDEDSENGYEYYYGDDTASRYAFYIALDNADGLMMGQHVYVELDLGQDAARDGIWLSSSYLLMEDDGIYVLAQNGQGKVEKRQVVVGEYDEFMDQYEILDGITSEDWIAYPMEDDLEGTMGVSQERYAEDAQ